MHGFPVMQVVEYRVPDDPPPLPPALSRSWWLRKYVLLCLSCGGAAALLGALFLTVYFMLRSYTSSLGYFETVPTYVPAAMLIVTGLIVMCLAGRRNRFGYLMKLCGGCCLLCAVLCVVVTITTTVIHMSRLQTLRECVYTLKTQTCTCYSVVLDTADRGDEGVRYVFNSTPDCEVVHGTLYSCLRAMFGLSVIGVLVCIFSCMLVYQLLSHEKKKMYWEQLELRCRYLYRQQRSPHHCSCCDQCRYPELSPWELMENRYWAPGRVGNLYSPNPGGEAGPRRAVSGWRWRRLPWSRPSPANNSNRDFSNNAVQGYRNAAGSPDSQYGFTSRPSPAERSSVVSATVEGTPAQGSRTEGPFVTEGSSGYDQHYFMWGPPPPYTNSPARRVPLFNILTTSQAKDQTTRSDTRLQLHNPLHHHHHHHHHHHCQRNQTSDDRMRHVEEFSSTEVLNPNEMDRQLHVENYVNTSEAEMAMMNNFSRENSADSSANDRVNNTLPARKSKKRLDISSVKSVSEITFTTQSGSHQSPPNTFPGSSYNMNSMTGSLSGLFTKPTCQMGENYHTIGTDGDISIKEESLAVEKYPITLSGENNGLGSCSSHMRYGQGQESQSHIICNKNEAAESEVYFADVSSCCNFSVHNDGQESSLYDEAVNHRKQRLEIVDGNVSGTFSRYPESVPPTHRHLLQNDSMVSVNLHQFHRLPPMIISEKGHQHNVHVLANVCNVPDNQELKSNCFTYQRQSSIRSRLPFPLPHHQTHCGDSSTVDEERPVSSLEMSNDMLDVETLARLSATSTENESLHQVFTNKTQNCNDEAFSSPMSISSTSPGSFPSVSLGDTRPGILNNASSSEVGTNSGATSSATTPASPSSTTASSDGFVNGSHGYSQGQTQQMVYDQHQIQQQKGHKHNLQPNNNSFRKVSNFDSTTEFGVIHGSEQLFLAPDAQYETVPQHSPSLSHRPTHTYQHHVHQHNFPIPQPSDDINGNASGKGIRPSAVINSPAHRPLQLPLHVMSSVTNNNLTDSLYHTATSTEEDESDFKQPLSSACYSDATMDSGCHSGSECATRRHGSSTRTSLRSTRVLGMKPNDSQEHEETNSLSSIRSVNV